MRAGAGRPSWEQNVQSPGLCPDAAGSSGARVFIADGDLVLGSWDTVFAEQLVGFPQTLLPFLPDLPALHPEPLLPLVWVREPECRGAWAALRADRMCAGRLPHTLSFSLSVDLLEFLLCSRPWGFRSSRRPVPALGGGGADSLAGDEGEECDPSDAEDRAQVPLGRRWGPWDPPHARFCRSAGFLALAESLQRTSLGCLLHTQAASCPRCRAV